jgi:uncharacterized protein YbjQ (UPF0145 family)
LLRTVTQNQELVQYTQALYDSRELAMERMQQDAEALWATGIVGANIHEHSHTWGSHVIEPPALVLPLID